MLGRKAIGGVGRVCGRLLYIEQGGDTCGSGIDNDAGQRRAYTKSEETSMTSPVTMSDEYKAEKWVRCPKEN